MKKRMMRITSGLVFGGTLLCLLPSIGLCQDCSALLFAGGPQGTLYPSIQAAINSASSFATIVVTGTCSENLMVNESKNYISLTGPATISGTGPAPTISIIGKGITVQNLTINGGGDGIQVVRGGTAFIENNSIETGGNGIILAFNSYAHIRGNIIQNNLRDGIVVADNSFARIGIRSNADVLAIPNTIQGNSYGVTVARSSSAQIIGNTISSNTEDGVRVTKVSQADISSNTIDENGRNGILVEQNSGVNLGRDEGETIFDSPNTSVVGNGAYGLSCDTGGYADGRLGTLDGVNRKAASRFTKYCVDSLVHESHRYPDSHSR